MSNEERKEKDSEVSSAPADTVRAKTIHVTVQAGAAREFPLSVFPGCLVEYSFHTKGGDIGFGILLEREDKSLKTVLERENVNAHEEAIAGKIKCTQSGTLWFMWDNTHSWFTSKELVYSVSRQPYPEGEQKGTEVISNNETEEVVETQEKMPVPTPPVVAVNSTATRPAPISKTTNSKNLKIILGTMTFAGQVNAPETLKMLNTFVALDKDGKTMHEIDTALMYNKGKTEILLGEILDATAELRSKISIATKANPFKGFGENLRPENVRQQLLKSLASLKTNSVDIFYLHAPDHVTNIEDTLRAVNALHSEGKFKNFGLSNYAAWEVMEIHHICKQNEWVLPTVYQGMYNAITREVEKELLPCLRRLNIKFYAYNPLAGGLLSGRYTESGLESEDLDALLRNKPQEGRFAVKDMKQKYGERYWNEDYFDAVLTIHKVCKKNNVSLTEASLRWLVWHSGLEHKFHDGVIIGASKLQHLEENMKALSLDQQHGPLPKDLVESFDEAWDICKGSVPSYNR